MKVLFLTQTRELGPASRYRVYQLLPYLEKMGFECEVSPAINDELYTKIYQGVGGFGLRRAAAAAIWRTRRSDLKRLRQFDAVFVQKGVFPGLYSGFERAIARRKPMVFDFDDAIWLPRQAGTRALRWLHRESATQEILRAAKAVIAGNEFLAEYARRYNSNVTVVPSAVDVTRYPRSRGGPVIGWIGSGSTLSYLKPLKTVFEKLGTKPRVIASGDPAALGFDVDFRPWKLGTELEELSGIGIGISPLPDTPWERGKCGVKLLQYMACGIPVVASPVGVHSQIVRHGLNGFFATSEQEWVTHLSNLMRDTALRASLGQIGREIVEARYSVEQAAASVANVLRSLHSS